MIFYRNKMLYVDKIRELGTSAFMLIQSKRYDVFDEEMARVTAQAFERENNAGKNQFISDFRRIWTINIKSPDIRLEDSIKGFEVLKMHLQEILSKVSQEKKTFSTMHTERYVEVLSGLIDISKNMITEVSELQKP